MYIDYIRSEQEKEKLKSYNFKTCNKCVEKPEKEKIKAKLKVCNLRICGICGGKLGPKTKDWEVLKKFVLYRYFFNNDKVIIFGEGKTDTYHLKHYIKFREKYTSICLPEKFDGWKDLDFRIFERKLFDTISRSGGTGDIKNLVSKYGKYCVGYHRTDRQKAAILVVDSDSGSNQVLSEVKKLKDSLEIKEGVYHVAHNLYVVALPRIADRETCIEDYYRGAFLDHNYRGNNIFERKDEYSHKCKLKNEFSTKIVPENPDVVDWSEFDKIFEQIQFVIDDFEARKKLVQSTPQVVK